MPKKGHKLAKRITKKKKKEYEQAESDSINIHLGSFNMHHNQINVC